MKLQRVLKGRGIKLAFLNSCSSRVVVERLQEAVEAVVGTSEGLQDDDARVFAQAFYRAIADGKTIAEACRDGGDCVVLADGKDIFHAAGKIDQPLVGCEESPASLRRADRVQVRASFAGVANGTYVQLDVFNGAESAVFFTAWHAEWTTPTKSHHVSVSCVQGDLPKRLQEQDRFRIVIDVGRDDFEGLSSLGLQGGNGEKYAALPQSLLGLRYDARKWHRLHPKRDEADHHHKLKHADVEITASLEEGTRGMPMLVVRFTNKSPFPIAVAGATLSWAYTPPRVRPQLTAEVTGIREAVEIEGRVTLRSRRPRLGAVQASETVIYEIGKEYGGVLYDILLGDVRDEDIVITVHSTKKAGWRACGEEIPLAVRTFARKLLAASQEQRMTR